MAPPNTVGNPLNAHSLSTFMVVSLAKDAELKNAYEAVALATHAAMIAVGFRLIGLGEDHQIEAHSEADEPQALPSEWNASSSYAFRYAHSQSAMEYLVKVNRMGGKAVIMAMGLGDDKTTSFDIAVNDYVSNGNLPYKRSDSEEESRKAIQNTFISEGRLSDYGDLFKLKVIQKLAPSLHKEGYEESRTEESSNHGTQEGSQREPPPGRNPAHYPPNYDPLRDGPNDPQPARPHPFNDPLAAPPRRPVPAGDFPPPGFEDEYEMNRGPRGGWPLGGRQPFNIGEDDLHPPGLGPHDPLRPHFGGGGLPRPGGLGGGMHPTFDDPLFAGGRGGNGGYDPMAPPGARWDDVGPGGPNRGGPRGFPGGGGMGGMGGRPPNPFGGYGSGDFI